MANPRDDFPESVKRELAKRAAQICSNPDCRLPTSGPHSDPTKAVLTGQAAHICAAAKDGPRYETSQTAEERKSIQNAIWLCANCNKKVDTDWKLWPKAKLCQMKDDHENWISGQGMIPAMPTITVCTRSGLRHHETLPAINQEVIDNVREQELIIRNMSRMSLHNINLALNMPENIITYGKVTKTAATNYEAKPATESWTVVSVQTGGKVVGKNDGKLPNHLLSIDVLPASEVFTIAFYTFAPAQVQLFDPATFQPLPTGDIDAILPLDLITFFVEGSYQFLLRGEYVTADVFIPLRYSWKNRAITTLAAQSSRAGYRVNPITVFPGIQIQS